MQRIAVAAYVVVASRLRELREVDRERGLTTTEIAVLTFVLVATAAAIGALLYSYAEGRVEDLDNIPATSIDSGGD